MLSVFSACAEVVPLMMVADRMLWRILRVRGGSSVSTLLDTTGELYSPRARR